MPDRHDAQLAGVHCAYPQRGELSAERMSSDDPYQVELLNVPDYKQGEFDGLCTYYTGAMMLATLFPAYAAYFGQSRTTTTSKRMSGDPIIENHPGNTDHRKVLARWLYRGEWIETMVEILNSIMESDHHRETEFEYYGRNRVDAAFHDICSSVDVGLPIMLGWEAKDYGCHAVLVVGYWRGRENWLITNDPGGNIEVSWNSLKEQQKRRFEVGLCTHHVGPRPMKRVTAKQEGTPTIYSWNTKRQEYEAVRY